MSKIEGDSDDPPLLVAVLAHIVSAVDFSAEYEQIHEPMEIER